MSQRKREHRKTFIYCADLLILILLTLSYAWVWYAKYNDTIIRPFMSKGNWLIFALYVITIALFSRIYGGYRVGHYRAANLAYSTALSLLPVNILTYFQISLIGRELMPVLPMLLLTLVQIGVIIFWAVLATKIYTKLYPPRRMLMIYGSDQATSLSRKMSARSEKYEIGKRISVDEGFDEIIRQIPLYDAVILCDIKAAERNRLLKYCYGNSVRTYLTPKISDVIIRGSQDVDLFDTPLLLSPNAGLSSEQAFIKRTMDLLISLLMIVLTSPIMAITALIIKLQDGGPVFFRQTRCTIHQRTFDVLKFRSMIVDAEQDGKSHPCTDGDPRITPIGRFIRKTRIDELPQLFNIVKGEMSLVGPRPERIEHVIAYSKEIPEFAFRCKVKAGLTGYAQIAGKYNTTAYDKLKLDLMYIERFSLLNDVKLLLRTIKVLFMKESTEGFTNPPSDEEGEGR